MPPNSEPLVSYILLAYNQERYIAEAVSGALAQTYGNLEIIISDDCSSDRTYSIIESLCDGYCGNHNLILNQNVENKGLIAHFNQLINMTAGRLIVLAAGDDVSLDHRAASLVSAWKKTGCLILGCNPQIIDAEGHINGKFYSTTIPSEYQWFDIINRGNSNLFITAVDISVFEHWGMLDETLPMEDQCLPFRASLMNQRAIHIIDEPLVQYRYHDDSMISGYMFSSDHSNDMKVIKNKLDAYIAVRSSWLNDLRNSTKHLINTNSRHYFITKLENSLSAYTLLLSILDSDSLVTRICIWWGALFKVNAKLAIKFLTIIPAISRKLFVRVLAKYIRYFRQGKRWMRGV